MLTETVSLDWIEDQVFLLRDHFGFPVVMAHPMGVSGADLLPLSLIGCAVWDVVAILNKRRKTIERFEIEVHGERSSEHPKVFKNIDVKFCFWGKDLTQDEVEKATHLSDEKYCSVLNMLKPTVKVTCAVEVNRA